MLLPLCSFIQPQKVCLVRAKCLCLEGSKTCKIAGVQTIKSTAGTLVWRRALTWQKHNGEERNWGLKGSSLAWLDCKGSSFRIKLLWSSGQKKNTEKGNKKAEIETDGPCGCNNRLYTSINYPIYSHERHENIFMGCFCSGCSLWTAE